MADFPGGDLLRIVSRMLTIRPWQLCKSGLQLYKKETPTQMFSREYCQDSKNTYFEEHLQTAAFVALTKKDPVFRLTTQTSVEM